MSGNTGQKKGFLAPRVTSKVHPKVLHTDLLAFFQQLSTLFSAGTPIYEALTCAAAQTQSGKLAEVIKNVSNKVAAGTALYSALDQHPKYFKTEWIQIIRSGEESGQLGEVLGRLVVQIDAAHQLRTKLVSAMIYPAIVLVVAVAAVAVMLVKVVPTFASMFESFGKELPGITVAVLETSAFLQNHGGKIFGGILVVVWLLKRYVRTPDGRRLKDKLLCGLPLIGEVMVQSCMQKFANNISMLLRAGMPLLDSIESLRGIFKTNTVYEDAMVQVAGSIGRGSNIADACERTGVFTSFVISMVRVGEQSGTMPAVMDEVEIFYRRKVETVVSRLTGMIETVVILVMGVTVAVILCAVYLPMFSMASGIS